MAYRIEITFSGDAPDEEMDRAKILGSPDVRDAVKALSDHLEAVGLPVKVEARTIRSGDRKFKNRPRIVEPAAAE